MLVCLVLRGRVWAICACVSQAKRKRPVTPEKPAKKQKGGESSRVGGASKSSSKDDKDDKDDNMFQVSVNLTARALNMVEIEA